MSLGPKPRQPFPASYKGRHLVRTHGRVFALPPHVDPDIALRTGRLFNHPTAIDAPTREQVEALIDGLESAEAPPAVVGSHGGYDLIAYRGQVFAVPEGTGTVDLAVAEDRTNSGVVAGATVEEVTAQLDDLAGCTAVEFAGWLPVYERAGNCGKHPQFNHAGDPPPGYRFTRSGPAYPRPGLLTRAGVAVGKKIGNAAVGLWTALRPFLALFRRVPGVGPVARLRLLRALVRLGYRMVRQGGRPLAVARFLLSRHFQSQLMLERSPGLVFLTSMPYTLNQRPWVIEIEDPTTLFYPLIQNGNTCGLDIKASPYFPIVKTLLEDDQCKGIVTHIESTARMVPKLFDSEAIAKKVFHRPLGVKLPARWQQHDEDEGEIHLLFINSWCQVPENFYVRGGLDILEAFAILRERYPQIRLTLRTVLPHLAHHYHRIIESGWVRVINRFLSAEEMSQLHADSHIFLLPAARIHVVSLLQAMAHGLAVVGSDGWGMEEYLRHGHNGFVVRGRYGKASWADEDAGMLREDYEPMWTADPAVVRGIVESVSLLVEDRQLRARLGRQARSDVETKYNPAQWNAGLKEVFDRATRV